MEVISLEDDRVIILDDKVIKKTFINEINNLSFAYENVNNMKINVNNLVYNVKVPRIYDYDDNRIIMEKCFGNNLEIMLRNSNMHNIGALYTNQIFDNFIKEKFYWKDFAPRNILISDDNISIVDFERGFENNDVKILDYLMDNVYEEYAAFLLPDERLYQFEDIIAKVDERSISMSKINSKRVRMILNRLGYETEVPFSIYILAVQMIIKFEEPYLKDNDIIYPIIDLEIYLKESGYEKYVNRIMGEYNGKIKSL